MQVLPWQSTKVFETKSTVCPESLERRGGKAQEPESFVQNCAGLMLLPPARRRPVDFLALVNCPSISSETQRRKNLIVFSSECSKHTFNRDKR